MNNDQLKDVVAAALDGSEDSVAALKELCQRLYAREQECAHLRGVFLAVDKQLEDASITKLAAQAKARETLARLKRDLQAGELEHVPQLISNLESALSGS